MKEPIKIRQCGVLRDNGKRDNPQARRVYLAGRSLPPTVLTYSTGGCLHPLVIIPPKHETTDE